MYGPFGFTSLVAVINPRWSPDGKFIVFVDMAAGDRGQMLRSSFQQRLFTVSADGGGPMLLVVGGEDPTWSPDSRTIAYGSRLPDGRDLRLLDLTSMKSTIVPDSRNRYSPRWSPDGRYLAAMNIGHSKLAIYSFASQTWTDLLKPPGSLNWPCWSRDSKSIFIRADYIRPGLENSVIRVGIGDKKTEMVASLAGIRTTSFFFWDSGWFGLTPDDRPITTLDTGIAEIYAFDLEYK